MTTTQHKLFADHTFYDDTGRNEREPVWYYIHCVITDTMLILNDDGAWQWVDNDTINAMPHLFSNRRLANRQIGVLGHGTPKKYLWKH